ncbi:hypothetical protein H8S95_12275 [Pontibacter sp. KCTC 32443]|uniref:hypothetical protein n=1 Tax=Pontibacter TaxID=323449 RepID=UPI00164DC957|nr:MULTISPECIES: hypothetical protein [Pontibacter]MBC5774844.1 hypothetical protein [Pontibacter sp. KCTC 32443]
MTTITVLITKVAAIERSQSLGGAPREVPVPLRHCEAGAKEAKAARCPKTGPPGHEGTKVNYRTVGE